MEASTQSPPVAADENPTPAGELATDSPPPSPKGKRDGLAPEIARIVDDLIASRFVSVDLEGVITRWSDAAETTFGWAAADVKGDGLLETIVTSDRSDLAELEGLFTPGGEGTIGKRLTVAARHREGYDFAVKLAFIPIRLAQSLDFNVVLRDMERASRSEDARTLLRERRKKLAWLVSKSIEPDLEESAEGARVVGTLVVFSLEAETQDAQAEPDGAPEQTAEEAPTKAAPAPLPVPAAERAPAPRTQGNVLPAERIERALAEELFVLHCQPVVDLHNDEVAQYELLIRMAGEDGQLLPPRAFLEPARLHGLMPAIDLWVIRQAVRLIDRHHVAGRTLRLEVNLASESIDNPDLPAAIEEELASTAADPGLLVLEIGAPAAVANVEETRRMATALRRLGCRLALDDFDSSLRMLLELRDVHLDYIKLDGALVAELSESRAAQLIVKALVDVARGMGAQTIAEWVTDDEVLMLLRQAGVGYAQGYRVGRPHPVSELPAGA